MKKSFMFTILFFIFIFFINAYAGSDLYDKFLIDIQEFETAEQSAQVERYKYSYAEYAVKKMIETNDMEGLKLMSQHYMWDVIRSIGFGGVPQIAAEAKNLDAFTFILSNKDYIKAVTTQSYMYSELIDTQRYKEEILVEYMKHLNVAKAIKEVNDRHLVLEKVQNQKEEIEKTKEQEQKTIERVNQVVQAPIEEEKTYKVTFTVRIHGTKEKANKKLKELKGFLEEGGYDYE